MKNWDSKEHITIDRNERRRMEISIKDRPKMTTNIDFVSCRIVLKIQQNNIKFLIVTICHVNLFWCMWLIPITGLKFWHCCVELNTGNGDMQSCLDSHNFIE